MKKIMLIIIVVFTMIGCTNNSQKNITNDVENRIDVEEVQKQKKLYYRELESECINVGEEMLRPDEFAVGDFNCDGILDMIAITNISFYKGEYAIFTLFTIVNNEIKKVPLPQLSVISLQQNMASFVVKDEYNSFEDSISFEYYDTEYTIDRNIAFEKTETYFYVTNNKYLTIKTKEGLEIFLYYGLGDELYKYNKDLAELHKNSRNYDKIDIDEWEKKDKLWNNAILDKAGVVSTYAYWIYNNNNVLHAFLPPCDYFVDLGENMEENYLDTINYSMVHISSNKENNGDNIKTLERISFYKNNIDYRTKYLTK